MSAEFAPGSFRPAPSFPPRAAAAAARGDLPRVRGSGTALHVSSHILAAMLQLTLDVRAAVSPAGASKERRDLLVHLELVVVPPCIAHELLICPPIGLHRLLVQVEIDIGSSGPVVGLAWVALQEGLDICRQPALGIQQRSAHLLAD
jgi:hypothetical protein